MSCDPCACGEEPPSSAQAPNTQSALTFGTGLV